MFVMKSLSKVLGIAILIPLVALLLSSCTHDNDLIGEIPPPDYQYGDDLISLETQWGFDKTHSSVRWESLYLGTSALLTGRFNEFSVESFTFDEDDPANISFVGKVVLSTVNTGEPGRDQGCLLGTFGTEVRDEAVLTSKSVQFDGNGGYNVVADFDFHGRIAEVDLHLTYAGLTHFDENSGLFGAPFSVAGFSGTFEFNALSDYLIESSNIADRVVVRCNLQFKKSG